MGPLCSGAAAETRPVGWLAWMRASWLPVHGWTVSQPRSRCAKSQGRMPGDHRFGVVFLLVTFLTPGFMPFALRASCAVRAAPAAQWPRKENVTRSPQASESSAVPSLRRMTRKLETPRARSGLLRDGSIGRATRFARAPSGSKEKPAIRRVFLEVPDQELDPGLRRGEALAEPRALRVGQCFT